MNGWSGNGPPSVDNFVGNGLSAKENDEAVKAILKLKVHDLSSIISSLNIRRPRSNKTEQQKALFVALFERNQSANVYKMALALSQPQGPHNYEPSKRSGGNVSAGGNNGMVNHQSNRSHPYAMNGRMNGVQGHPLHPHYQQNGMQQQHPQQQMMFPGHHPVQQANPAPRTWAPAFDTIALPFYDVQAVLLNPVELHATFTGQKQSKSLQFQFSLTNDHLNKIYRNENHPLPRYEIQLRFFNITDLHSVAGPLKDDFPLNANVRVDDTIVQLPHVIPTNKPNVEPKRPSRPVNITLSLHRTFNHKIVVEWLGDRRSYAATIVLVHRVHAGILFDRINTSTTRHKQIDVTKREICQKLTGTGEDDIAMDHLKISLLDPLVKCRMVTPARCMDCTHLQCFDLDSYLKMNEKKPTWQCPVCSSYCPYERLIVDDYFLDMLSKVDKNTTEVELKQDGSYDVIGIDDEVCLSDDDEDVKPINAAGSSTAGPSNGTTDQQNGGKRKKPATVADEDIIVLSDSDEEELNRAPEPAAVQKTPPRPAKKSKSDDIEIITLDDTPPRPAPAPLRQMSLQNQPTSSSAPSSAVPMSAPVTVNQGQTLSSALAQIGGDNGGPSTGRVTFNFDLQQHPPPPVGPSSSSSLQQQPAPPMHYQTIASQQQAQFGYSQMQHATMAQQQQFQHQQLIGRTNQMGGQQMHPQQPQQQQPQPLMSAQAGFYAQQQMNNAPPPPTSSTSSAFQRHQMPSTVPLLPLSEIPLPAAPSRRLMDVSGVTRRKRQTNTPIQDTVRNMM